MERISVPRVVISGLVPHVGKSLIMIGLAAELRQRGVSVSCCVVGTNFQQASLLRGMTERYVHSLDPSIESQGQILESIYMAGLGADIILIEGQGTLLNQVAGGEFVGGPDSYIARLAYSPICPVLDGYSSDREILDLLKLHSELLPNLDIGAPIANRLPADQAGLLAAVKRINDALVSDKRSPLLGVIPTILNPEELPPYGIMQTRKSSPLSRQYLMELSSIVAKCVDVDELMALAKKAPTIVLEDYSYTPASRRCKIAVSMDNAFGACFQDNLDYLKMYGADIVPFSPLADTGLPRGIGGVYITGAFLQEYGSDLIRNTPMLFALRKFHEDGGAIYSEGSGTAYLCREFQLADGRSRLNGVGIVPTLAVKGDQDEWTFKGTLLEDSVLGGRDMPISGVSTGDWQVNNPERMLRCLRMIKPNIGSMVEGFSPTGQVFSTFSFLHWGTNPLFAKNFVEASSVISFER